MASLMFMGSCKVVLVLALISSLHLLSAMCVEYEVCGDEGWVVPSSKKDQLYNQWASNNRFQVDDTLRFKYKKDSVLVVSGEEYDKCRSSHPMFFSNNGDTVFELDRPGLFYFISGVSGHCERGMKMIVKVLDPHDHEPPSSSNSTSGAPHQLMPPHKTSFIATIVLPLVISFWCNIINY